MRASRLRHRANFEIRSVSRDDYGGETASWSKLAMRWVSVEPLNGREYFAAEQIVGEANVRIRARYDDTLSTVTVKSHRIVYGSRVFDIRSIINPSERNAELIFMCREQNG